MLLLAELCYVRYFTRLISDLSMFMFWLICANLVRLACPKKFIGMRKMLPWGLWNVPSKPIVAFPLQIAPCIKRHFYVCLYGCMYKKHFI